MQNIPLPKLRLHRRAMAHPQSSKKAYPTLSNLAQVFGRSSANDLRFPKKGRVELWHKTTIQDKAEC